MKKILKISLCKRSEGGHMFALIHFRTSTPSLFSSVTPLSGFNTTAAIDTLYTINTSPLAIALFPAGPSMISPYVHHQPQLTSN
jgi:hypothetical protein